MTVKLKANDELEYAIVKEELGPGSYSFTPYIVVPKIDVEFTIPPDAIYIRLNSNVLKSQTLKEFKGA